MYTIKRNFKHNPMVPEKDINRKGKSSSGSDPSYISICEPYERSKAMQKNKKREPWRNSKRFEPIKGIYLGTDDGCLGRFHYEKQGYYDLPSYKDKTFSKESKASACLRGAPFGSKNAPRRDEFHNHITQLHWKELLHKEKFYMDKELKETAQKEASEGVTMETNNGSSYYIHPKASDYDKAKGKHELTGFDNSWKAETNGWIVKKGYGIKASSHGTLKTTNEQYGKFDLNTIERPKHARVSVTKEFYDISHLGSGK